MTPYSCFNVSIAGWNPDLKGTTCDTRTCCAFPLFGLDNVTLTISPSRILLVLAAIMKKKIKIKFKKRKCSNEEENCTNQQKDESWQSRRTRRRSNQTELSLPYRSILRWTPSSPTPRRSTPKLNKDQYSMFIRRDQCFVGKCDTSREDLRGRERGVLSENGGNWNCKSCREKRDSPAEPFRRRNRLCSTSSSGLSLTPCKSSSPFCHRTPFSLSLSLALVAE